MGSRKIRARATLPGFSTPMPAEFKVFEDGGVEIDTQDGPPIVLVRATPTEEEVRAARMRLWGFLEWQYSPCEFISWFDRHHEDLGIAPSRCPEGSND